MNLKTGFVVIAVFLIWLSSIAPALAQQAQHGRYTGSSKGSLEDDFSPGASIRYLPLSLSGGTKLTLISPEHWNAVAKKISGNLEKSHSFFSKLFGDIPAFQSSVRLMDEEDFYAETGAPRWTNAMYYRKQIIIPMSRSEAIDFDNLFRSVRHEYTHAVIHALSNGKAPGWLDEGIAQWAEGSENPALRPALYNWLSDNKPLPLLMLQGGFTKLESKMVPAAYAQSLFAANTMINTFGFKEIRGYFDSLRTGSNKPGAFKNNFRMSESKFEQHLAKTLNRWHAKHSEHGF